MPAASNRAGTCHSAVVRGHAHHGVLHLLAAIDYVLEWPESWPALREGFAFFGANAMAGLLAPMAELYRKLKALGPGAEATPEILAAAGEIDGVLFSYLDEAVRLVAGYIRSHPAEFVRPADHQAPASPDH